MSNVRLQGLSLTLWMMACARIFAAVLPLHFGAWSLAAEAMAEKVPPIIDTGVVGGGGVCWYDADRLVVVKRTPSQAGRESEFEGLYILWAGKPGELNKVEIPSNIASGIQRQLWDISCQDGGIVFSVPVANKKASQLYRLTIGEDPELIAEMRGAMTQVLSLKGKYVLASSRVINRGMFEGHDACPASFVKPTFRVLCWDIGFVRRWSLSNFVLHEYRWSDTISVQGKDGKAELIRNAEKQLIDKSGQPIHFALFLSDLNGTKLARLDNDVVYKTAVSTELFVTNDESFVYSSCHRLELSNSTDDGVCRYRLDGSEQRWEEVFRFNTPREFKASIQWVRVSPNGDVYFVLAGAKAPHHGIWRFDSRTKAITKLTNPNHFNDVVSAISPGGDWVAISRSGDAGDKLLLFRGGGQ